MPLKSLLQSGKSVLLALGVNAVPAVGFFVRGWSAETTMLVYLLENLLLVGITSLRVRALAPAFSDPIPGEKSKSRRELLQGFLVSGLGFSLGAGVFILVIFFLFMRMSVDTATIGVGLAWIALLESLEAFSDLFFIRPASFEWAEGLVQQTMGRVALLYLGVFIGVFIGVFGKTEWFVIPFIGLKTMVDVGGPLQLAWGQVKTWRQWA